MPRFADYTTRTPSLGVDKEGMKGYKLLQILYGVGEVPPGLNAAQAL
jgi:hypothetical protein